MSARDRRLVRLEAVSAPKSGRILDFGECVLVIGADDGLGGMTGSEFDAPGRKLGDELPEGVMDLEAKLWAAHPDQKNPIADLLAHISKFGRRLGEPKSDYRVRVARHIKAGSGA